MNTPIADMVAEMLENCTPKETIILAVRTTELALRGSRPVDETAEKRRAWDREYRHRKKYGPPDSTRNPPEDASYLENSKSLQGVESKKERKPRGTKIPPDWVPKESHYAEGLKRGMNRARVDDLGETLRLWCASNANTAKTTRADWDSFFMSWIRREKIVGNGINGHHADSSTGRATAKETNLVASLGRGAISSLSQGVAGRHEGPSSGSYDAAGRDDAYGRSKVAG